MLKWFSKQKTADSSANNPNQENEDLSPVSSSSDLTDADYEFLFNQLLDGVAHGWNQLRVIKFLQNLGVRGEESRWVAWLEKFATKIPDATNDSQRRLGAVMLRLAEVTQSATELSQLSAISAQIGKKLFFGNIANLVWEYDGLDLVFPSNATIENLAEEEDNKIQDNLKSISEPEVEENIELDEIESHPSDELIQPILEPEVEENIKLDQIEPHPPDELIQPISEPEVEENIESNKIESPENPVQNSSLMLELVESWFNLGLKQANTGDLSGAIESWRKALEINPNLPEIWHNLGSALGRLENYPKAIDSFNHALEIDPKSHQAWNERAHAFYHMQQWEKAIASWNKALAINPENYQFWYHHGCALEQLQRLDDAIVSYAKALEISPNFEAARSKYVKLITRL